MVVLKTETQKSDMEDPAEVRSYLRQNTEFEGINLCSRFKGHHNYNHIFETGEARYVLRAATGSEDRGLAQERKILEFLETQGINFVPRSVIYDPENDIHIISYVGEQDTQLADLNEKQLRTWVRNLVTIHSLSFEEYSEFCERNGYGYETPETRQDELEAFSDRLEYARECLGQQEIIGWAEDQIQQLKKSIEERKCDEAGLAHKDLANSIRTSREKVYLIDWEFARFVCKPEDDLAGVFVSESINQELREKIKDIYRRETGNRLDLEELEVAGKIKILLEIAWAIKRTAKIEKDDDSHWEKDYMDFARRKRKQFENRVFIPS